MRGADRTAITRASSPNGLVRGTVRSKGMTVPPIVTRNRALKRYLPPPLASEKLLGGGGKPICESENRAFFFSFYSSFITFLSHWDGCIRPNADRS
ncbi:hypothetical protein CDAR_565691 [Caerostris darwini]|uniref:Uncharacterized protein n=1 Tax=Caerostris darwini TaxID=1538125 RepID=A0AAV4UYD5_9ARAC|nr:hypothetical protein CDAR_565691 [Caerostris darwini]